MDLLWVPGNLGCTAGLGAQKFCRCVFAQPITGYTPA